MSIGKQDNTGSRSELQSRHVLRFIEPRTVLEGAGVKLKRSIALPELDYVDPFLLFDHFGSHNPQDYLAGFPMHPHRGIETVTYVLDGRVTHRDSIGNEGTIGPGDVQWMTAGGGIMHEEMPGPQDGRMEGFQLWVNLPAKLKMARPRYQEIASAQIPEIERDDGARIRIIAGTVDGIQGPVREIAADPTYLDIAIPPNGSFVHPISRGHASFAYLYRGTGRFATEQGQDRAVAHPKLVVFGNGDYVEFSAGEQGAQILLISGMPLGEPVARHGPFVMNTREEIRQALWDLQNGTFVQPA